MGFQKQQQKTFLLFDHLQYYVFIHTATCHIEVLSTESISKRIFLSAGANIFRFLPIVHFPVSGRLNLVDMTKIYIIY